MTLSLHAPAKINLFLHVIGRRSDGYHNLQTAFQFLELSDELSFSLSPSIILASSPLNIPPEKNLIWRAAHLLQQHTKSNKGATITVKKRVPVGAGLGGGSSDAATTLVALNHLWQTQLSQAELLQLGLQLGADVPVFIHGHSAFAEGIGEKLVSLDLPEKWCLCIIPPCEISTAEIFAAKELTRNTTPITIDDFLIRGGHNDCEAVVRHRYQEVNEAFAWLEQFAVPRLTGTGCAVFALFDTQQEALAICAKMPKNLQGLVSKTINLSPLYAL